MYTHIVQYYETDRMGVTHHSNYIRWMEEARIDYFNRLGFRFDELEKRGLVSPILEVSCACKKPTTFMDAVQIDVTVEKYRGARLVLGYIMKNADGETVCTGTSVNCFMNSEGQLIRLKKEYPELDALLSEQAAGE